MRPLDVLEWVKREPFEPFGLHMSNGEVYPVRHPENVLVGTAVCYLPKFRDDIVEHMSSISLRHIVKIEPLNGARADSN